MKKNYYFIDLNPNISVANIWIDGGTSLDKKNKKGINQILCTLLTRGCKNYDNFSFSDYLDSYGAELNFEAVEDGISICLKAVTQYFDKLYPLIKLIIEEPNLYEKDFIFCKKNALDNIKKDKENCFNISFDNWKKIAYNKHPYAFNCNGYEETINLINYEDILDEYKTFRKRNKFLLTNFNKDHLVNINDIKDNIFRNQKISSKINVTKNSMNNFIENYSNSKQIIIILGSTTCPHNNKDNLALKILESYLSFGMSSLLFKIFREKNGLTYDSGIFYPTRKSNAPFVVYLSVKENNALKAFNLIISIWEGLINNLICKDELSLAKLKLKNSFLHNYQTVEEITYRKVVLLALGMDPCFDQNIINDIDTLSSEDIQKVSQRYLRYPFLSISGNRNICKKIKLIWQKKF